MQKAGTCIAIYVLISFRLFNQVYETTHLVIDEEFHLKQGDHYCHGRFHIWDPKITTFPGLYLLSAALLMPLQACNVFMLRLSVFLASVINLYLFMKIRQTITGSPTIKKIHILEALTLAYLPPLHFFAHLYYTDIPSLTAILLLLLFSLQNRHLLASLCGALAVLMRQTNIVWVGMVLAINALNFVVLKAHPFLKSRHVAPNYTIKDLRIVAESYFHRPDLVLSHARSIVWQFFGYFLTIATFVAFLVLNGGIVVGDRTAHEAALHLPQVGDDLRRRKYDVKKNFSYLFQAFYFGLFVSIFAPSLVLANLGDVTRTLLRKWHLTLAAAVVMALIIHYNTLVHPYLLADNRHYIFYVWNRFYGRLWYARYLAIPVYLLGLVTAWKTLDNVRSAGMTLSFALCTFVSIALQRLIEIRYFFIPFIILRLFAGESKPKLILLELLFYAVVNAATFYLFFTKEIHWSNYEEVQRLIW